MDISQFLDEQEWGEVGFAPLSRRVAVHGRVRCVTLYVLSKHMYPLLRRIWN
ncbi:MAG: hypothetical protein P0107_00370 [Nitrosomonas sp.]|nr:hypothetical protein [Nitrosomonas sp.]